MGKRKPVWRPESGTWSQGSGRTGIGSSMKRNRGVTYTTGQVRVAVFPGSISARAARISQEGAPPQQSQRVIRAPSTVKRVGASPSGKVPLARSAWIESRFRPSRSASAMVAFRSRSSGTSL